MRTCLRSVRAWRSLLCIKFSFGRWVTPVHVLLAACQMHAAGKREVNKRDNVVMGWMGGDDGQKRSAISASIHRTFSTLLRGCRLSHAWAWAWAWAEEWVSTPSENEGTRDRGV